MERMDYYQKSLMKLFSLGFHDFSENLRVLYEMNGDAQDAVECLELQMATKISLLEQEGGEEESKILDDKEPQLVEQHKLVKKEQKPPKAPLFEEEFPPATREIFSISP